VTDLIGCRYNERELMVGVVVVVAVTVLLQLSLLPSDERNLGKTVQDRSMQRAAARARALVGIK
jgi:hypothetical protein